MRSKTSHAYDEAIALQVACIIQAFLAEARYLLQQLEECLLSIGPAPDHARPSSSAPAGLPASARRLFEIPQPIFGTIVETYLRRRGITALRGTANLRFHPRCYYRPDPDSPIETWPAMIAAVTDLSGTITGAHRTWLDASARRIGPG